MFVRYALLADSATLDANGKVNAIGIFDIIFVKKIPSVHRDMTIVADLEGAATEKGEHTLSIELRDDKANRLASFEQKIVLNTSPVSQSVVRAGFVAKLQDFPFMKAGRYEFVMFINNDRFLGRIPFTVIQLRKAGEG
jgi:hypothetical protein